MYVLCWLRGLSFDPCRKRCRRDFVSTPSPNSTTQPPLATSDISFDRHQILLLLVQRHERDANRHGYTFRPLLQLMRQAAHMLPDDVTPGADPDNSGEGVEEDLPGGYLRFLLTPRARNSDGIVTIDATDKDVNEGDAHADDNHGDDNAADGHMGKATAVCTDTPKDEKGGADGDTVPQPLRKAVLVFAPRLLPIRDRDDDAGAMGGIWRRVFSFVLMIFVMPL